jgi:hypothetical protein
MGSTTPDPPNGSQRPSAGRDWTTVAILLLLAASGLIPWAGVLAGDPPAYTAELGAAVTIAASLALVVTLIEMRGRKDEPPDRSDTRSRKLR